MIAFYLMYQFEGIKMGKKMHTNKISISGMDNQYLIVMWTSSNCYPQPSVNNFISARGFPHFSKFIKKCFEHNDFPLAKSLFKFFLLLLLK